MLPDLMSLKGLFKIDPIVTDNIVFKCHYKLTVLILAASATLISLKQYVGDPIDCFVSADGKSPVPSEVLDTYCWIHSTHTLPNQPDNQPDIPGMGTPKEGESLRYHKYYQWVGFFLMFQLITFYIPRLAWKYWEGGRMRSLVEDIKTVVMPNEITENAKQNLINYLLINMNQHRTYAFTFFFCELLTAINIVGQIFLVDTFLGGEFTSYGGNVVAEAGKDPEDRSDPMSYVFPKVTKCLFKSYGPSGTVQHYDAFCVLPVNILNEKVFIFLWFWYIILAVVTGIAILGRLVTILMPKVRSFLLRKQLGKNFDEDEVSIVIRRSNVGDWFIMMLIRSNINQWMFQEVIEDLGKKLIDKNI